MPSYNQNFGYNYPPYPYGVNYQPFMPQQPNFNNVNNMVSGNQNQQQPQMNQFAFVNGIEGAKSFQMMPNQTIMLMDSENPVVFMKSSNSMGQSSLKYYKLTEVSEQDLRNQANPQPIQQNEEYALKSDFEGLSKRIDEISRRIEKPYKKDSNTEKGGNQ